MRRAFDQHDDFERQRCVDDFACRTVRGKLEREPRPKILAKIAYYPRLANMGAKASAAASVSQSGWFDGWGSRSGVLPLEGNATSIG